MFTNTLPSTPTQWIRLLSISTRFSFPDLRKRAISELHNNYTIDPVEIIVLAETCRVPEWKEPAFVDLVRREEFIQYKEAMKLGPKLSHALYVAREEARKNTASACRRCQGSSTEEPALRNDTTSSNLTTHNNLPLCHPTLQDDLSPSNPKSHDGPSSLDPILHNDSSHSAPTSFDDRPYPDPHLYSAFQGSSTEEPAPRNDTTSSDLTTRNNLPLSHPTHQADPSSSNPKSHESPSSLGPILHNNSSHSAPTSFDDRPYPDPHLYSAFQGSSTEEPAPRNDTTSSDLTTHNNLPLSHPTPQDDLSPSNPTSHDGPSSLDPILHNDPSRSARTSFDDFLFPHLHRYPLRKLIAPTEKGWLDEDNETKHSYRDDWRSACSQPSWTPGWTTLGGTILT